MTSADIYPLAQRLIDSIPARLRTWQGLPTDPSDRDHLADTFLLICDEHLGDIGGEQNLYNILISESLAGFLTQWGCRYGNLDDDVDRATDNLVLALGGTVLDRGVYALAEGTLITVAAIAYLIAWVTLLDLLNEEA